MQVAHCWDQDGRFRFGVGEIFIADGDGDDGCGREEVGHAGSEPLISGRYVGADGADVAVFNGYDHVNACVGEGFQDVWIGVVDFDLVDDCGLEHLGHLLMGREVVTERAVVYPDTCHVS